MPKYRKKPVPVKIEPVTGERKIKTLEGSQEIGPGQYLATGVNGEQWAFGRDVFDTYEPVPGSPGHYTKRGDVVVEAVRLAYPVEIFRPGWEHKGEAGDWLITRTPDDQYIVQADVFEKTYEPADEN
jgi:hypothetical protein